MLSRWNRIVVPGFRFRWPRSRGGALVWCRLGGNQPPHRVFAISYVGAAASLPSGRSGALQ
jgi:hypothetical protein